MDIEQAINKYCFFPIAVFIWFYYVSNNLFFFQIYLFTFYLKEYLFSHF